MLHSPSLLHPYILYHPLSTLYPLYLYHPLYPLYPKVEDVNNVLRKQREDHAHYVGEAYRTPALALGPHGL